MHRLLRDRLGITFPRPTLQRIHTTSGGNPFFAFEGARAVEARGGRLDAGESLPGVDDSSVFGWMLCRRSRSRRSLRPRRSLSRRLTSSRP